MGCPTSIREGERKYLSGCPLLASGNLEIGLQPGEAGERHIEGGGCEPVGEVSRSGGAGPARSCRDGETGQTIAVRHGEVHQLRTVSMVARSAMLNRGSWLRSPRIAASTNATCVLIWRIRRSERRRSKPLAQM